MEILEAALARKDARRLDGETAFKLYDTYGFPLDLTADIAPRARRRRSTEPASTRRWQRSSERARAAGKFKAGRAARVLRARATSSSATTRCRGARRSSRCIASGTPVRRARAPARRASWCSTARRSTPSPAARSATAASSRRAGAALFDVDDTQKIQAEVFGHHGTLKTGALRVGDAVDGAGRRGRARAHHAQPLGHPPDAQGAARSAGHARAAEGLAGRRRQDALRLHAQRADDGRTRSARSKRSSTPRSSRNEPTLGARA